jgi:hypothetical protein
MFGFSLRVLPDEPSNPTAPKGQNEVAQGQNEAPPWVRVAVGTGKLALR